MVKFRHADTLFFGLTDINVDRLKAGQPISFDLAQLGKDAERVVIFHGHTEESIMKQLVDMGVIHPALLAEIAKMNG